MRVFGLMLAVLFGLAAPAFAETVTPDPLHLCYSGGCGGFNGVTASGSTQNLSGWGVSSSPAGDSGELSIVVLVPQNETFTGTLSGGPNPQTMPPTAYTITSFSDVGTFSSGQNLETVLGLTLANGSPKNPFSAYSAASLALDSGFTSVIWEATITDPNPFTTGTQAGQTSTLNNLFSLSQGPNGSIVTAFLDEGSSTGVVSTAQSSALALSGTPVTVTPLPSAIVFMFTGLLGLIGFGRKWAIPSA